MGLKKGDYAELDYGRSPLLRWLRQAGAALCRFRFVSTVAKFMIAGGCFFNCPVSRAQDIISVAKISEPGFPETILISHATPHIEPTFIKRSAFLKFVKFNMADRNSALSHLRPRRNYIVAAKFLGEFKCFAKPICVELPKNDPAHILRGQITRIEECDITRKHPIARLVLFNASRSDAQISALYGSERFLGNMDGFVGEPSGNQTKKGGYGSGDEEPQRIVGEPGRINGQQRVGIALSGFFFGLVALWFGLNALDVGDQRRGIGLIGLSGFILLSNCFAFWWGW